MLRSGLTSDQIHARAARTRAVYVAAIEEEARLAGELDAFGPSAENVAMLRDRQRMRWERIAVRVPGLERDRGLLGRGDDRRQQVRWATPAGALPLVRSTTTRWERAQLVAPSPAVAVASLTWAVPNDDAPHG